MSFAARQAIRIAYHLLKWAGDDSSDASARRFHKILDHARRNYRRAQTEEIVAATEGKVVDGPFAGLAFSEATCREDGYIGTKLFGFYEQEIQKILASWQGKRFDTVVNIGAGSGFFALGCAHLFRPGRCWAVDVDEATLALCRENFALNGLDGGAEFRLSMTGDELAAIVRGDPGALVISDCEGYERELFTGDTAGDFGRAHLVVECHDNVEPGITEHLQALFEGSHDLAVVSEGPRDPNRIPLLRNRNSYDRWLAVSEDRAETMHWLIATPRNR